MRPISLVRHLSSLLRLVAVDQDIQTHPYFLELMSEKNIIHAVPLQDVAVQAVSLGRLEPDDGRGPLALGGPAEKSIHLPHATVTSRWASFEMTRSFAFILWKYRHRSSSPLSSSCRPHVRSFPSVTGGFASWIHASSLKRSASARKVSGSVWSIYDTLRVIITFLTGQRISSAAPKAFSRSATR